MATKKRKLKKTGRHLATILLVALAIFLVGGFSAFRILDLKMEQRDLLAQQEELTKQKEKLKEQLNNVNDPEFIEEEARKQLKMIMPGETLYILQDEKQEDDQDQENGNEEDGDDENQ